MSNQQKIESSQKVIIELEEKIKCYKHNSNSISHDFESQNKAQSELDGLQKELAEQNEKLVKLLKEEVATREEEEEKVEIKKEVEKLYHSIFAKSPYKNVQKILDKEHYKIFDQDASEYSVEQLEEILEEKSFRAEAYKKLIPLTKESDKVAIYHQIIALCEKYIEYIDLVIAEKEEIAKREKEEEESDTITEYVCFKCFNVHKGQICPICHPSQPKKKQSKKQPKKTYELVLANRDEYGDADEIYHFAIIDRQVEDIKYAKEIWIDCECNTIDVNEFDQYGLVDQYDLTKAPKYIQKIAQKIMS